MRLLAMKWDFLHKKYVKNIDVVLFKLVFYEIDKA